MSAGRNKGAPSARRSRTETVEGVEIHSVELEFCDAADLLPELLAIVAPAGGVANGGLNIGDGIAAMASALLGGRLTSLMPKVLAATTVIIPGVGQVDLTSRENLNRAFSGRKKFIFPAMKLALEVSFADFLDGLKLVGVTIPTLSPSADSDLSTTATG